MGGGGKREADLEEEDIKNLFLSIMEDYYDDVIPPFSYFSPISVDESGSCSRKREEEENVRAEQLLSGRKKRKQMSEKFHALRSMVPTLFPVCKPSREKIVEDTVKYITHLEEEKHRLDAIRKNQWNKQKEPKRDGPNSSANVILLSNIAFLAIELPQRRGLMTEIFRVVEKHCAEVLEASFSRKDHKLISFIATLLFWNDGFNAAENMKKELMLL